MKQGYIIRLAWRYLRHRSFATLVSVIAIALSLAIVTGVGLTNFAIKKTAVEGSIRYPLVVGPGGASSVQLILSTIFHVDKPTGTIPFDAYETLKKDPRVIAAFPLAAADSLQSYPVMGTDEAFLDDLKVGCLQGNIDLSKPENAVLGFDVANRLGMGVGSRFFGSHGMTGDAGAHQHKEVEYDTVCVLNPTGGPEDTAVYTNYETVWLIHKKHMASHHHHKDQKHHEAPAAETAHHEGEAHEGEHAEAAHHDGETHEGEHAEAAHHDGETHEGDHAEAVHHEGEAHEGEHAEAAHHEGEAHEGHHGEHAADAHAGHKHDKFMLTDGKLTAVLVRTANPAFTAALEREWTLKDGTQAVDTARSIRRLVSYLNKGERLVEAFGMLTLLVAVIMILVTLIMSINERRKELALMRSLGIGQGTIALIIMWEAFFITLMGAGLGLVAGHALAWWAQPLLKSMAGIAIEPFVITSMEGLGLGLTLIAGQLLALVSMIWTYRMNVIEEIAKE